MADNNYFSNTGERTGTETQDYAAMSERRRTSTSSSPGQSTSGHEPASMHTSIASVQNETVRRRPRPLDYGSTRSSTNMSSRPQIFSPKQQQQPLKRPNLGKRASSNVTPHRGQNFSVDDDPDEVTKDLQLARTHSKQDSERDRNLRKKETTLRRRPTAQLPTLARVESSGYEEEEERYEARRTGSDAATTTAPPHDSNVEPSSEDTLQGEEDEEEEEESPSPDPEDEADLSDAESFTLKDRQEAINETHPFGIRIWKPALYKKNRSVQRNAEGDIHSSPGGFVSRWLWVFNTLWTIIFGWWLSLITGIGGIVCLAFAILRAPGCAEYGRVLINLSHYLLFPFGKFVRLERDEDYLDEDEGEGRSISEYERWQTGDLEEGRLFFGPTDIGRSIIGRRRDEVVDAPAEETDSLLTGRPTRESAKSRAKKRLFGRGKWNLGRVIFFFSFYFLITPSLFFVSAICWFLVFTIPMGKVTLLVFYHLRRHPLALSFHDEHHYLGANAIPRGDRGSVILLCTYRAVGLKYWKYTIDGTNIFLINLLGLVVFAIFDYFVLYETLGVRSWLTAPGLVFVLALASIIPLAYFIGQAVASISAQSSMGVGATINAFFSTVVEVFLYCIALRDGKAQLVEGSIIGSIFAGILFLPGLSMCFGAIKRKTQRFNVKSAGVTSNMLLFAVIGAFGPTLFYQIYGSHELNCHQCVSTGGGDSDRDCRRCFFDQVPAIYDRFFLEAVRPYIWFAAICLFLSYVVGLIFTLRTHAAVIWNNEPDEKKEVKTDQLGQRQGDRRINALNRYDLRQTSITPDAGTLGAQAAARPGASRNETAGTLSRDNIRDSQMYKRILSQSLKQAAVSRTKDAEDAAPIGDGQTPHLVPPKSSNGTQLFANEDYQDLLQHVAEMAATAATVATRDATRAPRRAALMTMTSSIGSIKHAPKDNTLVHSVSNIEPGSLGEAEDPVVADSAQHDETPGGHDAPNWSRTKSAVILLTATIAYAVIAEILVDTVDAVLSNVDIDEKFLGITLFALVPNTTEFLNAISFAMNGNVALSMEIGSSYALQVMLLQIPCLVLFSALSPFWLPAGREVIEHTFNLIFPQWDMVTVILSVFLMGWVVGEGKSNYFKGSTLIFTYLVVTVGFYFSGYNNKMDLMGVDRFETMAPGSSAMSFTTIGRFGNGRAY